MAKQAKGHTVFVFRQDEVGEGGVVRIVAGEAGDGRGVFAKGDVGAGDRMSLEGMTEPVSLVEEEVGPGIHFLERDCGTPR
jgi:hypothetical protein